MEVLVRTQPRAGVTVGVVRVEGQVWATRHLDDPNPPLWPLSGQLMKLCEDPVVVVGELSAGTGVEARGEGTVVELGDGAWLGVTPAVNELRGPFVRVRSDGTREVVPSERWLGIPVPLPDPTPETRAFGRAVATALLDDLALHPVPGALARIVIRAFPSPDDPSHLSIHVLATGDEQPPGHAAYFPIGWANEEREFARTDRVLVSAAVRAAADAVAAAAPEDDERRLDLFDVAHGDMWDALTELIRVREIDVVERFEIVVTDFEGP